LEVCESILLRIEDKAEEFEVTLHLHNNRAAALNMLGRYSESIVVLEKCLKFRRKHYFYKNLADAYFSLGIPEKAAMNYEKAIRLDPGYDEAFYNLAVTQFLQQEYTSSKLNIESALKIDGNN
jgi:tetratricopeptide (TPR) repeat protein